MKWSNEPRLHWKAKAFVRVTYLGNVWIIRRNAEGVVFARQRFIRGPLRMISTFRTYRTRKYQVSEIYTRVWKPRERKKETRTKKRGEESVWESSRFSLHSYAESCDPPACSSLFLSSLRPSLSLPPPFFFLSFSSSWGQNHDHASPSFPFFGVVHSLASPPHIFSRLHRMAFPYEVARSSRPSLIYSAVCFSLSFARWRFRGISRLVKISASLIEDSR